MKNYSAILYWIIAIFLSGTLIVFLTILAYYRSGVISFCSSIDNDVIASFGTFVGGFVGVIFSIGTALLVYITYDSQRRHLERQTHHINNAERYLKIQRFEEKFFRLLAIHESIKKDLHVNSSDFLTKLDDADNANFEYSKLFSVIRDDFARFYDAPTIVPNIQLQVNYDDYIADEIPPLDQYKARIKYKYRFFFRHFRLLYSYYQQFFILLLSIFSILSILVYLTSQVHSLLRTLLFVELL